MRVKAQGGAANHIFGSHRRLGGFCISDGRFEVFLRLFPLLFAVLFSSCGSRELHRPAQVMRVGPIARFLQASETFLPELRLFIRVDDRGLSVMSTECTVDLSPLELVEVGRERFFISRFSGAHYSVEGKVLSGPAKAPLPYFRARLAEGSWGSARDTLFVELGSLNEVEPDWRLPLAAADSGGSRRTQEWARFSR